jgi:hypothetical protein
MSSRTHDHGRSHLEQISDQISGLIDPLAARCRGWPAETVTPILAQAWHRQFRGELDEPGLSDTAAALRDGRPWTEALWTDGWA